MNKLLVLFSLLFFIGCHTTHEFVEVECIKSGVSYRVFMPCRELIFQAKYWDKNLNLISDEKIWLMPNGKPWVFDPEKQNEIVIQYQYNESKIEVLEAFSLNPELSDWASMEVTGIIENDNRIWMHPFRQNQYAFMEVAPFPEVRLPLEVNKSWNNTLSIHNWGVWSNTKISSYYEVVDYEKLHLKIGEIIAWKIHAFAQASFGTSTHNFWFHPELGFVKMVIHNYAGQTLEIELVEVIDG